MKDWLTSSSNEVLTGKGAVANHEQVDSRSHRGWTGDVAAMLTAVCEHWVAQARLDGNLANHGRPSTLAQVNASAPWPSSTWRSGDRRSRPLRN